MSPYRTLDMTVLQLAVLLALVNMCCATRDSNCEHGGTYDGSRCACAFPWGGLTCNQCLLETCQNGGTLKLNGECKCLCKQYWGGDKCETCTKTCGSHGTINLQTCVCNCDPSWAGEQCESCSLTCYHGGTMNTSTCACECALPWAGSQCGTCGLVCKNNGRVQTEDCTCKCANSWSGDDCSQCIKHCEHNGVMDNNICECKCPDNWQGGLCERCPVGSCSNGGTYNASDCKCECANLWKGVSCTDCANLSCANGATANTRDCTCICAGGWSGGYCTVCNVNCRHGVLHTDKCECTCLQGWKGNTCDSCIDLACVNGGLQDTQNCKCRCPEPYTGLTCSELATLPPAVLNVGYGVSSDTSGHAILVFKKPLYTTEKTHIDGHLYFKKLLAVDATTQASGPGIPLLFGSDTEVRGITSTGVIEISGDTNLHANLLVKTVKHFDNDVHKDADKRINIDGSVSSTGVFSASSIAAQASGNYIHWSGDVKVVDEASLDILKITNDLFIEGNLAVTGKMDFPLLDSWPAEDPNTPITIQGSLKVETIFLNQISTIGAEITVLDGNLHVTGAVETNVINSLKESYVDCNGLVIKPYSPPTPDEVAVTLINREPKPDQFGTDKLVELAETIVDFSTGSAGPTVEGDGQDTESWCTGEILYSSRTMDFENTFRYLTLEQRLDDVRSQGDGGGNNGYAVTDDGGKYCSLFKGHHLCPSTMDFRFVTDSGASFSFTLYASLQSGGQFQYHLDEGRFIKKLQEGHYQVAGLGDSNTYDLKFNRKLCRIQIKSHLSAKGTVYIQKREEILPSQHLLMPVLGGGQPMGLVSQG